MSTWREFLQEAQARMASCGIESPQIESEILASEIGKVRRSELFFLYNEEITAATEKNMREALERRLKREPLQYITGTAPFRNVELSVNPAVLIPRPETELLVSEALKYLPRNGRLADIGTGSGAIALSIAYERRDVQVVAVDVSSMALETAKRNQERLSLWGRVEFRLGDLTVPLQKGGEKYDVITANLPYVSEQEYACCQPEVKDFEPKLALVAENNGLALILRLIHEATDVLRSGGALLLETGAEQTPAVAGAMNDAGYKNIAVKKDLTGRSRFVIGQKP